MTKATGPNLTIQAVELPYGNYGFKGRLFAAVPESDKPPHGGSGSVAPADTGDCQVHRLQVSGGALELLARGLPARLGSLGSAYPMLVSRVLS